MSKDIVLSEKDRLRFLAKVDRRGDDECWPWLGNKSPGGFGRISLSGQPLLASRVAYFLATGGGNPGRIRSFRIVRAERTFCAATQNT